MSKTQIIIGETQFQYLHADSIATWLVKKARGGDTYECVIIGDEWNGARKVFGGEEIRSAIVQSKAWDALRNEQTDWFASLKIGDIYHYHNGFGQFVRCMVVHDQDEQLGVYMNRFQPIALVGNWQNYDLPKRQSDGRVHLPYHASKVVNATGAWQPSLTCIYEHPDYSRAYTSYGDPRTMEPISLNVPEMTSAEIELADLTKACSTVIELLSGNRLSADEYRTAMRKAATILLQNVGEGE